MGNILQFAPVGTGRPKDGGRAEGRLGEVVIFPGVRIERHADAPEQGPLEAPRKRARARKKQA